MRWRTTLSHDESGSIVIVSEPEGLTAAIMGLTRHPELHSLVKEFKTSLKLYGNNGQQNGYRDWLKNIEYTFGPDSVIHELIEYAPDNYLFDEVYRSEVGVQTIVESLDFDHSLEFMGVQKGFWRKAQSRWDVPVNIQSTLDLDGNAVSVISPTNLQLTPQALRYTDNWNIKAAADFLDDSIPIPPTYILTAAKPFGHFDFNIKTLQEIEKSFEYDFAPQADLDRIFEKYIVKYSGSYRFFIDVWAADGSLYFGGGDINDVTLWIKKNEEAPIAATRTILPGFNGLFSTEITRFELDETLALTANDAVRIYWEFTAGSGTRPFGIVYDGTTYWDALANTYTATNIYTVTADTTFKANTIESFLIHDVIASVMDRITDHSRFYSELLGSTETLARVYAENGCYWNNMIAKGLHIRGYTTAQKQLSISMKEIWEGLNPHLNLSVGYETVDGVEVIRLEEKAYQYDSSSMSVLLSGVQKIKRKYSDQYFNAVETGSSKGLIENISGIDDPQKETRANAFKNIGRKLTLVSTWITQSLTFEDCRRKTITKSADYKYDNDTFMVEVTQVGDEYRPRLNEDYDSVTGLLNESSRYNKRWWPARMFLRWSNYIFNGCQNYIGMLYKFTEGTGNYEAASERKPDDCRDNYDGANLAENGSIAVTTDHLYIPQLFEIEHYLTMEEFKTIDSLRKKAIGVSQYAESAGGHKEFFIEDLQFEMMSGQIKLTGYFKDPFNIEHIPPSLTISQGGKIFDATFDFTWE